MLRAFEKLRWEYSAAKRLRDLWWGRHQANKKPEAALLLIYSLQSSLKRAESTIEMIGSSGVLSRKATS